MEYVIVVEVRIMKKIKVILLIVLISFFINLFGCSNQRTSSQKIYTTIYPLYSLTKLIVGDKFEVLKIVKDGAEIHSFEPTSKDIAMLTSAKAVIYLGMVDEWVKKPLEGTNVKLFKASNGIKFVDSDPHVWTSPRLLQKMAKNIADFVISIDKQDANYYRKNYDYVLEKLKELDTKFYNLSKNAKAKEFLILHPSFGYFANDYGLTQYSVTGVNEEEEPSAARMREILNLIKTKNIKYILVDPNENLPILKSLSHDTGIKQVYIYGMGIVNKEQSQNQTVLSLMEKNYKAFEMVLNK